jgi:single-strand DNA-binding protein
MANLNKVFLMGRMTRDPEVRYTPQGTAVAELGLAVNRFYRDQNGENREEVCYVDVQAWGNRAQTMQKYFRKGSPIFIEGHLHFSSWETKEGEKRSKLRVKMDHFEFLDSQSSRPGFDAGGTAPPSTAPSSGARSTATSANEGRSSYPNHPVDDDLNLPPRNGPEEDVPF